MSEPKKSIEIEILDKKYKSRLPDFIWRAVEIRNPKRKFWLKSISGLSRRCLAYTEKRRLAELIQRRCLATATTVSGQERSSRAADLLL